MLRLKFSLNLFLTGQLIVAFLFAGCLQAQPLKKIKEFQPGKIENVSVDRLGNFFLIFQNGSIKKYDANGKTLAFLKNAETPSLIEPWFHPRIFTYYQRGQHYINFDRNFKNPDDQVLDPSVAIKPSLACPTNDNKLLVFDRADLSVKRINPFNNQVLSEFAIDSMQFSVKPNFTYIREYQNLIFLLDANSGVVIYNNVGKIVNQIKIKANNFGFYGEELYFLQRSKVVFFDLYTEKTREIEIGEGKFVLVTDERILEVTEKDRVIIFEFKETAPTDK